MITSAATASAWVELRVRQADQVEAVVADGHADAEEQQQARHAQPVGQARAQHAGDEQDRAPEEELVRRQLDVHGRVNRLPGAEVNPSFGR